MKSAPRSLDCEIPNLESLLCAPDPALNSTKAIWNNTLLSFSETAGAAIGGVGRPALSAPMRNLKSEI